MAKTVKLSDFDKALNRILRRYGDDVTAATEKATQAVARTARDELRETSPRRTGAYAKDWASGKGPATRFSRSAIVYNRSHYQLTHLLEHGHALRQGGRAKPIPHIAPAEEHAIQNIEKAVKEIVQD